MDGGMQLEVTVVVTTEKLSVSFKSFCALVMKAEFWKLNPVVTALVTATWYVTTPLAPRARSPRSHVMVSPRAEQPPEQLTNATWLGSVSVSCTPAAAVPLSLF